MGKYLLADILGHGGVNQSPYITKKITRPRGNIIIRPLISVLIVAAVGFLVVVVNGMAEGVIQAAEDNAVDAEIIMTRRDR